MSRARDALLSEKHYDDDASLVNSNSISGSDSEGDDVEGAEDVKDSDRHILEETAEHEKLLHKPTRLEAARGVFGLREGRQDGQQGGSKRPKERKKNRKLSRRGKKESSDMMFEMEGGFKDTSSQSSFETDDLQWDTKHQKQSHRGRLAVIYLSIVALFVALVFGAYKASRKHLYTPTTQALVRFNNGTHVFRPTTILISLDGFRADFLNRNITPALNAFIASGVSPKYMLPSFPSVTFPNHFTLVTGLYPESHGIVSNQFWDPAFKEEFYYTNLGVSMQPKWWTAEPLWVTAEHQGVRTAIHMWPGSEAHIPDVQPTYLDKYNGSEALPRKVDRLLGWLDLAGDDDEGVVSDTEKRPQFIAAYVPNVDAAGHKFGPNSTEIRATIADVDSMLTLLVEGLYERNLTEIVNIVIVSDHGMATTSNTRLIQLEDLMDTSLIDHIDGWPLRGLRLKNPDRDVPILYEQLSRQAERAGSFDVYTLDTMPERYHFTNSDRIAPLWIVPKTGWAVVEKHEFDVADAQTTGREYAPKGLHGYDHEHPLMRAIFVARGPAFPHEPNSRVPVFQNTEVYNIVCDSLGVVPHSSNGTLRLPLQPVGLHSDIDEPALDTPADPVEHDSTDQEDGGKQDEGEKHNTPPVKEGDHDDDATDDEKAGDESDDEGKDTTEKPKGKWWQFLHDQLEKAKQWAKEFVESIKNNHKGQGDPPV